MQQSSDKHPRLLSKIDTACAVNNVQTSSANTTQNRDHEQFV